MISQGEARGGTGTWDLKFIDYLFPKLPSAHLHWSSSHVHCLIELAKVEFFATDRRDFEIVIAQFPVELHQIILEILAFSSFILLVEEL